MYSKNLLSRVQLFFRRNEDAFVLFGVVLFFGSFVVWGFLNNASPQFFGLAVIGTVVCTVVYICGRIPRI